MTRRLTFKVHFHEHGKPYHVSALHINQAQIIAGKLAAKYGWRVASVGVVIR